MQVAVLDDDIHQLDLLSHAVQALGYACHRFSTGAELLHALQQASFDLFLIDWELPDMPGLDVLRTLRLGHRTQSPVIFVTQRDDERDVVQALSAGADDYVVKPVRSAELQARVPLERGVWAWLSTGGHRPGTFGHGGPAMKMPWLVGAACALLASGPAWSEEMVPYDVQRGESLYVIAERLLEDARQWPEVAR